MKVDLYTTKDKYSIIYADPPWKYDNMKNNDPGMGGITYDIMDLEDIKNLPVERICDKDCALFMWATMPKLKEAFEVIDAWGFRYITCAFVWVKQNPKNDGIYSGLGHWTNGNAELCLFGKRGTPKRVAKNVKQIVLAHRKRHSEKPAEVRDRIVNLMGDMPRIELFAREDVSGWDVWGNEVEKRRNMKIIIDISEEELGNLSENTDHLIEIIGEGFIIPDDHGKIIDVKEFDNYLIGREASFRELIKTLPAIIEENKE